MTRYPVVTNNTCLWVVVQVAVCPLLVCSPLSPTNFLCSLLSPSHKHTHQHNTQHTTVLAALPPCLRGCRLVWSGSSPRWCCGKGRCAALLCA